MNSEEAMNILENISKKKFPYGRLPTIQECLFAIEYPETAEQWVKDYLKNSPEYDKFLRECLGLGKNQ